MGDAAEKSDTDVAHMWRKAEAVRDWVPGSNVAWSQCIEVYIKS